MEGYAGNILKIDLDSETISTEPLSEKLVKNYIGGRGFASRILFDTLKHGIDPFSPENIIVIASGPLAGTLTPGAGKVTFAVKSPATGSYGDSNMGGHFASEMKYAGYDVILITGKLKSPGYIYIYNEDVKIINADLLWGKGSIETETLLKKSLGEQVQIAVIGPAGENLVKFACISHDFGRQAGRVGVGAVMGSKNLKAIAVRGTKGFPLHDVEQSIRLGKDLFKDCMQHPALKEWQDYGTAGVTVWCNEIGGFPTKNFQSGFFKDYKNLSGQEMRKRIVVNDKACFACPMNCGKYSKVKNSKSEVYVEGPEYETTALLGGNLGVKSIEDVAYLNYLCDELGLDTISAGNVIGFAMECFEKGKISKKKADDLDLKFGKVNAAAELLGKIARKEGIGNILADGVKSAAENFGKGTEKFAMQIKGLEWSGYESRNAPAMLLAYMTCDIGAHHNRAWAITHDIAAGRDKIEGKAQKVIELQHIRPLFDLLGVCRLQWVELGIDLEKYVPIFKAVSGIEYNLPDLLKASERVWNLNRLFYIKEKGEARAADMPPERIYKDPVENGPTKGKKMKLEDVEKLLDDYYSLRGWDKEGIPTNAKLEELGLKEDGEKVLKRKKNEDTPKSSRTSKELSRRR